MSLAQILGHLRTGDVIIVPRGDNAARFRVPVALGRPDAVPVNEIKSRKLLRSLITLRKVGGKK